MRPGDFADGERELNEAVALFACRFRDDAYGMVAGLQTGNPALPASIGKFCDVSRFGVDRNPKDFGIGSRNRRGKRDRFFKGIFIKKIFSAQFRSDYRKLDWLWPLVLPGQNGGKRIPMRLELIGYALRQ